VLFELENSDSFSPITAESSFSKDVIDGSSEQLILAMVKIIINSKTVNRFILK